MPLVVGVAFKPVTKVYYFDPGGFNDLKPGERVMVDTARGRTLGVVVNAVREVVSDEISGTLKPVLRRASALDMVQQDQQLHREPEALAVSRVRASALGLPMKIVKVEYNFDGTSLLVYFTAEQRVDFRNLVHDLAQALRTHVEMRQIGVRDEAKFLSGYGRCGRELCCSGWLREFTPVSIKMAKQQDLPLNPVEISGVCGRLLCCLSYENDFYTESRRQLPKLNSTLMTPEGPGKVRQVHVLRNSVTVLVQGPNDTKLMVEVPIPESEGDAEPGCAGCPKATGGAAGRQPIVLASEAEAEEELSEDEEDAVDTSELRDLEDAPNEEPRRPRSSGALSPHHARRQRPRKRGR
jgi:cell fate regulator YaaT (PSP1 superfamily)